MLYSWDIAQFRTALDGWRGEHVFNMHPFARQRIAVDAEPGRCEELEAATAVDFTPPARLFGEPEVPACLVGIAPGRIAIGPTVALTLPNARIVGTTAVVDADAHLHTPLRVTTERLPAALGRNGSNSEGYVLRQEAEGLHAYFFTGHQPRRIAGRALFLPNAETGNYGSFLIRVLPQLLAARKLVGRFDCYVATDRATYLRDALKLLDLPDLPVYETAEVVGDTFDAVVVAAVPDSEGLMPPWARTAIADVAKPLRERDGEGPRRVFVSRALSRVRVPQYRPLLNEAALQARFESLGFVACCCETLSLFEQIRLFAGAQWIAGPSGSGMLNSLFSTEAARVVDFESFTVAVRQHAKVYASAGHAYAFCFGRFAPDDVRERSLRGWSVPDTLIDAVAAWVGKPGPG